MSMVLSPAIEKTPGICGGDARIANTRIAVWLLVAHRKEGVSDQQLLEFYPHLTHADLAAAWWYYAEHREEIETAIQEQEDA